MDVHSILTKIIEKIWRRFGEALRKRFLPVCMYISLGIYIYEHLLEIILQNNVFGVQLNYLFWFSGFRQWIFLRWFLGMLLSLHLSSLLQSVMITSMLSLHILMFRLPNATNWWVSLQVCIYIKILHPLSFPFYLRIEISKPA